MFKPMRNTHPIFSKINMALVDLPAPNNISLWWNMGSLLGLCLTIQLITGIMLSMHYSASLDTAFSSTIHITQDMNLGWLIRMIHANGASMFFMFLYLHISRGIYYGSYIYLETWNIGMLLFVLVMATSFMGYVLPWGQMSFWGATVITNLFSAIPYIGKSLVEWIWGGFAVDSPTLSRFFSLHFMLPFIISFLAILHMMFLHQTGSNNPIGINSDSTRIPFHSFYSSKDLMGYISSLTLFSMLILYLPNFLTDPENFLLANPLVTPIHIKPEWYFLWVYAILRSIPNKLGGVIALFSALLILFLLPMLFKKNLKSKSFNPTLQIMFWYLMISWLILTWIGGRPVETPFILIGQVFTFSYFFYFISAPLLSYFWEKQM